jgi:hypothetical protein
VQEASLVHRVGSGHCNREALFETCIASLEHAPRPAVFGF